MQTLSIYSGVRNAHAGVLSERRPSKLKRAISWLLVFGGTFLFALGAYEFLTSVLNQAEVAEDWHPPCDKENSYTPIPLGDAFARLSIPRLDANMFVVEGTGKKQLRRGPGHLAGTALPGTAGNCVIAGHRDTHFRVLKDIRRGDDIVVENGLGRFVYRVTKVSIVPPKDTRSLMPTPGPTLNLVTCYPFYYVGPAPKRFVVRAELWQQTSNRPRVLDGG